MKCKKSTRTAIILGLVLVWFNTPSAARAGLTYLVTVDTSPLAGQSGIVSFEFNPGISSYQAATATITNLTTDGALMGDTVLYGGASGDLNPVPPALSQLGLNNSGVFNDGDQYLTYGNTISFDITLSGDAINNPSAAAAAGTTFSFFTQDTSFNPLLTSNPAGSALDINIPAGSDAVTYTSYSTAPDGITVTPEFTSVPEPASLSLLLVGTAVFGVRRLITNLRGENNSGYTGK